MDLYLANGTGSLAFMPSKAISDFESCIWTDRYRGAGNFELKVPWDPALAANLRTFKYLRASHSRSVMMIETAVVEKTEDNPRDLLVNITGRSLEAFLENRDNEFSGTRDSEVRTGSRGAIANAIINEYAINNTTAVNNIPGLSIGPDLPGDSVTLTLPRGPLYTTIMNVLEPENLGFRIQGVYNSADGSQTPGVLRFEVYAGLDRYSASAVALGRYMEFSPDQENFSNISTLESIANYKNHARMLGAKAATNVYAPGVAPTISGFERRTIVVDASDIGADSTTTVAEDIEALKLRGLEILTSPENRYQQLVDGEASLGEYYFSVAGLGDIVWVRDANNVKSRVRISEKIWSSDATGDKLVPTFEAVTDG